MAVLRSRHPTSCKMALQCLIVVSVKLFATSFAPTPLLRRYNSLMRPMASHPILNSKITSANDIDIKEEVSGVPSVEDATARKDEETNIISSKLVGDENSTTSNFLGVSENVLGILVLGTVPIFWGTYVPVVRGLYEIDPPIPGFVFSTAYFAVASVSAFALLSFSSTSNPSMEAPLVEQKDGYNAILAGAELGFYLFLGNCLQVIGVKTVPSDRAGFLVQLTTILVPLVQATLSGSLKSVSASTWTACAVALLGISIMSYDGMPVPGWSLPSLTRGDALILSAAMMYSLHVVRLGRWANLTTPLKLVAYKATAELILGIISILLLVLIASSSQVIAPDDSSNVLSFFQESGREIISFFQVAHERLAAHTLSDSTLQQVVGATLWTGMVSTAYTTYAQTYGQRRVTPANANLIYSLQPVFTALFAFILLGETMGPLGFVGGALIGGAVYVAATQSASSSSSAAE